MRPHTIKPLFSITATATGGRNGQARTVDGRLSADLSVPNEMGGPGAPGTITPEHLFAAAWAACFGGALELVAQRHKKDASRTLVACEVTIGPREGGGFGLAAVLRVEDRSLRKAELQALVEEAHEEICPYSHATRGNIDVKFEIVGA